MALSQTTLKGLPKTPGVYLFCDATGQIIYIGKAVNLYRRIHQYFNTKLTIGSKTNQLVSQIVNVKTIPTLTEFEALILEAKLIRLHLPRYNSIAKDDRSPLYIGVSLGEELPRIRLLRKTAIARSGLTAEGKNGVFGPFQSARMAKVILRSLRRVIPFCLQKKRDGKPCFYTHLGYCQPCPSQLAKMPNCENRQSLVRQYRKNVFRLVHILTGKAKTVLRQMEGEMRQAAKGGLYEQASQIKQQIKNLYTLLATRYDPNIYLENEMKHEDVALQEAVELQKALQKIYPDLGRLTRIEAVDVSNLSGKEATGSLVVMTDGCIDTDQYRKFKIKITAGANDVAMIREVLHRRFAHNEWPLPNLLVIDGGKAQLAVAMQVLQERGIALPIIGLSKRFEEVVGFKKGYYLNLRLSLTSPELHLLQRLRNEAHRFALAYHRLLRKKAGLPARVCVVKPGV